MEELELINGGPGKGRETPCVVHCPRDLALDDRVLAAPGYLGNQRYGGFLREHEGREGKAHGKGA